MKIELSEKEQIDITFNGTDGVITVHFDTKDHPNTISVTADLSDSDGRKGIIYCENFGIYLR